MMNAITNHWVTRIIFEKNYRLLEKDCRKLIKSGVSTRNLQIDQVKLNSSLILF